MTNTLETAILQTRDYAIAWGTANGYEIPFEIKRRDPVEPGREVKEKAENSLYRIMRRYWKRQQVFLREWMRFRFPMRKAIAPPLAELNGMYGDELINAQVLNWLLKAQQAGVILFSDMNLLGINYDLVNAEAAKWARKYSGLLVKEIDKTTKKMVREQISAFIETPGYTVGDVIRNLPYTEQRALMISTTETTKAFAMAEQLSGNQMQKEFPDVRVIKQWWTNNDSLVCLVCGPNHAKITLVDGVFPSGHDRPPAHPRCRCWMSTTTDITETAELWNK